MLLARFRIQVCLVREIIELTKYLSKESFMQMSIIFNPVKQLLKTGTLIGIFAFSPILFANNGSLAIAQQGDVSIAAPRNGIDKQHVESQFGAPLQKVAAVGEPPISKWVYQDFTVYFERDLVLHSVLHK